MEQMSQGEEAMGGQQESGWDEDERSQEESLWSVPEDSQGEDVPEQSQRVEDVASSTGDKASSPVSEEEPQPCAPTGPGSPSPVGTALAAEAAPALPRTSAAPTGAAGQEEPPEPVTAQEEEKAVEAPVSSQELPSAGTQSPPCCNQALLDLARHLICEIVHRALLEVQGSEWQPQGPLDLEQCMLVETGEEATWEREQSPGLTPQSPLSPLPARLGALSEEQLEGPASSSVREEQGSDQEASDWDIPWDSSSDPDMSQGEYDSETELFLKAENRVRELTPWVENITFRTGDNRLSPVMEEEKPQPCSPEGPCSPSPMGTAAAAEAAPALPRTSAVPSNPPEAEPAAGALAGAAGQEEPSEPVAAWEEEKAEDSPVPSEDLSSLGTLSPLSIPDNSQDSWPAFLCREHSSCGQLLSQARVQQLEEQDALEEAAGAAEAAPDQREQSPVPGKSHMEQELYQQEGVQEAELSLGERNNSQGGSQRRECAEQELSPEVSDWEELMEKEISHGEVNNSQEHSEWEEYLEKELFQEHSDWEENNKQELSQGNVNSWEEHIGQGLSQEQPSLGQDMPQGNNHRHSVHSSWEDNSDPELAQDTWKVGSNCGTWMKTLAPEEDSWDEVSILELPPQEDKEQKWRVFMADGLSVPLPREAWVEEQEPELHSPELLCASSASLESQGSMGHAASPIQAFHGQLAPLRKRPSRFRRALQALRRLFRCPCLAAPPEERHGHGTDSSHCSRAAPPCGAAAPTGL